MFRVILCVMTMCLPGWVSAQAIGTVNFDFDVDQLDAEAKAKVAEIAAQLDAIDSYKPTVVIGHTDAVGTSGYNFDLGLRRARNVAAALTTAGVTVDRMTRMACDIAPTPLPLMAETMIAAIPVLETDRATSLKNKSFGCGGG